MNPSAPARNPDRASRRRSRRMPLGAAIVVAVLAAVSTIDADGGAFQASDPRAAANVLDSMVGAILLVVLGLLAAAAAIHRPGLPGPPPSSRSTTIDA